ncbi:MAG: response regulator [Chloroflexi bacterium]|nr:response regulator [Chloroflexota bacterium]
MTSILVVDDYIVQQRVLRQVLSSAGYDVTVAGDGMEALEYLAAEQYALVILDIAMPEMDGIEVLSRMRDREPTRALPVIMLTASGEEEAKAIARKAGADAFLTKPASSHEIIATVQGMIGEAG